MAMIKKQRWVVGLTTFSYFHSVGFYVFVRTTDQMKPTHWLLVYTLTRNRISAHHVTASSQRLRGTQSEDLWRSRNVGEKICFYQIHISNCDWFKHVNVLPLCCTEPLPVVLRCSAR